MQNPEKNPVFTLEQAIEPIVNCRITFADQRRLVSEMFVATVENAPNNETDNFTAKMYSPVYLALLQLFDNLERIPQLMMDNQIMLLDNMDVNMCDADFLSLITKKK